METAWLLWLLKGSLLLLGAILLSLCLTRSNPRWRIFVCEAVAVAVLMLPVVSMSPWAIEIPRWTLGAPVPAVPALSLTKSGAASESLSRREMAFEQTGGLAPGDVGRATAEGIAGPEKRWDWVTRTGLVIYGFGLVLLSVRYLRCRRRLERFLTSLLPATPVAQATMGRLVPAFGLSVQPTLLVSEETLSPFCCDASKREKVVVIPPSLTLPENAPVLESVLRHELHHLSHGDLWRTRLMNGFASLCWFHPLAWWLRRVHAGAMEELGDRVAARGASGREQYRSMLAQLTLTQQRQLQACGSLVLGMFGKPQIIARLRRLKTAIPSDPLSRRARGTYLLFLLAPVMLVLGASQFSVAQSAKRGKPERDWLSEFPAESRAAVRRSVNEALEALRRFQLEDGSMARSSAPASTVAPDGAGNPPRDGQETGVTALAGMAFLAHGGGAKDSPNRVPMRRCLDYVLKCQREDGQFGASSRQASGSLYHHFIATWFLAGAHPHLEDAALKSNVEEALGRAAKIIVAAQSIPKVAATRGGWRYTPQSRDSDLSCTAWAIRALEAVRRTGAEVPEAAFEKALRYVRSMQNDDGGFAYTGPGESNVSRTGMALYCLQTAGQGESEEATRAADYLVARSKLPEALEHFEYYGILWGATAFHGRDGAQAEAYFKWMTAHLLRSQNGGRWHGSLGDVLSTVFVLLAYAPADLN